MNLLLLIFLSLLSYTGTGRDHGSFVEVIRDMDQLGISKLSVSGNGSSLDLL